MPVKEILWEDIANRLSETISNKEINLFQLGCYQHNKRTIKKIALSDIPPIDIYNCYKHNQFLKFELNFKRNWYYYQQSINLYNYANLIKYFQRFFNIETESKLIYIDKHDCAKFYQLIEEPFLLNKANMKFISDSDHELASVIFRRFKNTLVIKIQIFNIQSQQVLLSNWNQINKLSEQLDTLKEFGIDSNLVINRAIYYYSTFSK